MSSRSGRRDRSWERDDRNDRNRDRYPRGGRGDSKNYYDEGRRRSSRSRSPHRRGAGERRGSDRREPYRRDREDEKKSRGERDRRDGRDGRRRDDGRDRSDKRNSPRREDIGGGSRKATKEEEESDKRTPQPFIASMPPLQSSNSEPTRHSPIVQSRPNLDPDAPDEINEEGEEMDAVNDDDAAMMAIMGMAGFGSTKGKPVEGNQEGAVQVKKMRTWRQYMNRRGGFNRPLDKIK